MVIGVVLLDDTVLEVCGDGALLGFLMPVGVELVRGDLGVLLFGALFGGLVGDETCIFLSVASVLRMGGVWSW